MTAIAIFGEASASEKLVRASMSETLETHLKFMGDEPFELVIFDKGGETAVVQDWAHEAGVTFHAAWSPSEAVEQAWTIAKSQAKVLALLGDEEPTGDVAHALKKASQHGLEIRDLAEAGVTYVYLEGDVPPTTHKEPVVAEEQEDYTWAEVGEMADDPDHESQADAEAAITEAAAEAGVDPDEYATWAEVAEVLQALEDEQNDEATNVEEVEDEAVEDEAEEAEAEGFTREHFKGKGIKEVRALAVQSGIENAAKLSRDDLVDALCGINLPEEATPAEAAEIESHAIPTFDPTNIPPALVDAIANAVVNKLAERLTIS